MHGGLEVALVSGLVSLSRYGVASSGPLPDPRRVSLTLVARGFASFHDGFALIGTTIDVAAPAVAPGPFPVVVVGHDQPPEWMGTPVVSTAA
jgi:hypothetical protein